MISDQIKSLILEEQPRQGGHFVRNVDMDTYLAKLGEKAEIVSDVIDGHCRGFVVFYCNDVNTRKAFITFVMVDPRDRGVGIGQALVDFVFSVARSKGFNSCQLEVSKSNQPAYNLFRSKGFQLVEDRGEIYLMEADL